ncbi:SacI homology domain containing protein [Trichomonas vaginalis G3]|uniref:SacI homology domain containing protein n=1 Tax=Trichomonas vaginalis (strain ATCC PRA-98 / G3) TaxID=412133 RepID=A2G4H5_TRIV3|nr:phosphoinositide phosphatase SAC9-related family [Trichomonas vaginalis G3]EAX87941.1 SacI homology domain containing protein [Trichomonas vaginalis G3]KAI5521934.1 phosphoinositide phosphatase SAC9-related family [Trichomonas vaginalis G3]|eukprot:XP_001300871.1 SacI homology domain containing protein [Trichomonas vaginalis G3]
MENHSIFHNINAAEGYIDVVYKAKVIAQGIGLTGMVRIGSRLYINIITDAVPVAYFANKHTIYKVTKTQPLWFPLTYYAKLTDDDLRRSQRIEDFPITDFHMFCDTLDLTMTCGHNVSKPDFIWNKWLAKPFSDLGVSDACVYLYQGTAVSEILNFDNTLNRYTLITLRSSEHPGTRYTARGINQLGYAANEVQCELIIENSEGKLFSHVFRRGTVPVEWQTLVGSALPTASLKVQDNSDTYSPDYFKRIRKEFASQDFKGFVCVNLLHTDPKHSERALCDAYIRAIEGVKKIEGLADTEYIEFDWHAKKKELDTPKTVEEYWGLILAKIHEPTFTCMEVEDLQPLQTTSEEKTLQFTNDSELSKMEMHTTAFQQHVIRVNCMDSLDRTNVGCFFYLWLVIFKFLYKEIPNQLSYSKILGQDLHLRHFLANAFVDIGNVVSTMYTNTDACMTNIFREIGNIEVKAQSDGAIAMSRRFQNFLKDKFRVKIIKLFVGFDYERVLHGLDYGSELICASGYPGCFLTPYPGKLEQLNILDNLIDYKPSFLKLQRLGDQTQIRLLLSRPVFLDSIVMKSTAEFPPCFVSFEGGLTHGSMVTLSSRFAFPVVPQQGSFVYRLTPEFMNGKQTLVRILIINIWTMPQPENSQEKPPNRKLTLSNIFVFGSTKQKRCEQKWFPQTYTNLDFLDLMKPKNWPKITDTSSLDETILSHTEATFENAILLEYARLHHKHSKLGLMAQLAYFGQNPSDYLLTNFKPKPIGFDVSKHNCNNQGKEQWKCGWCGMTFCENCSKMHTEKKSIFFDADTNICNKCHEIYKKRKEKLKNLQCFYHYYTRLHYPIQDEWETWFKPRLNTTNRFLEFPRVSFIDAGDMNGFHDGPECNLIFINDQNFEIKGQHSFQLTLGAIHVIDSIDIDASDDANIVFQVVGNEDNIQTDIECKFEPGVKSKKVSMCTCLMIVYIHSGSLRKISLHTSQYIKKIFSASPDPNSNNYLALPDPVSKRNNLNYAENSIFIKFSRPQTVNGILCEKFNAIGSLIVYFNGDVESSGEIEYFNLPSGVSDYAVYMVKEKKNVTSIKVFAVDTRTEFNNGKISFF